MHPVLIALGPLRLSTYGVFVALGYLAAILWLKAQLPRTPWMDEDGFWTMVYALFAGAVLGGKALYLLVSPPSWPSSVLGFLDELRYGFVFYGGAAGALAAGWWVSRRLAIPYLSTADYFGVAAPLGHAIGRLGCLGAGCCYGRPAAVSWAVTVGPSPWCATPPALWGVPLHPTQLYEAGANLLIACLARFWLLPRAQRGRLVPGTVFLSYAALYAAARFAIEFYRGDDRGGTLAALSVSQWIALLSGAAALALMVRRGVRAA